MSVTSASGDPSTRTFPSTPLLETVCSSCGTRVRNQLPQQTQLDPHHFVPKTHPRIELRGRMDSLHAVLQMCAHQEIHGPNADWIRAALADLIAYVREIGSAEYHLRPASPIIVNGLDGDAINEMSHHPEKLGLGHSFLSPDSATVTHWLNLARTEARAAELRAWNHVSDPADGVFGSIALGFNLISSTLYYLELLSECSTRIDHVG